MVQPLWKPVWQFLTMLNTEFPYKFRNTTSCYMPKRRESRDLNKDMYPHVQSSIIYNEQEGEPTPAPVSRWMNKQHGVFTYTQEDAVLRKDILTPATTCMNLEDTTLSDVSQSQRIDIVWLHVCEILVKFRDTKKENRGCQGVGGMGSWHLMGGEFPFGKMTGRGYGGW